MVPLTTEHGGATLCGPGNSSKRRLVNEKHQQGAAVLLSDKHTVKTHTHLHSTNHARASCPRGGSTRSRATRSTSGMFPLCVYGTETLSP